MLLPPGAGRCADTTAAAGDIAVADRHAPGTVDRHRHRWCPSGASALTMSSADRVIAVRVDVRQPGGRNLDGRARRHVPQPPVVVAAVDARRRFDRECRIRHVVGAHRAHVHIASLGGLDAMTQRPERGEDRTVARFVVAELTVDEHIWVESSNTRTRPVSAAVVPSVPVTVRSKTTVVTSSGAVNVGVGPASVPEPAVTSGPDVCAHAIDASGVPAAMPTAASWTAAPRSTAWSTPALAMAGTPTVVVVSGTVVEVGRRGGGGGGRCRRRRRRGGLFVATRSTTNAPITASSPRTAATLAAMVIPPTAAFVHRSCRCSRRKPSAVMTANCPHLLSLAGQAGLADLVEARPDEPDETAFPRG
jgi:hypothetical protein